MKAILEPDASALIILEISSTSFARQFNYFLTLTSSAASDNTEVAEQSAQPEFRRNRLAVPRGSGRVVLEAFAYLSKDNRKLLGSMSLPPDIPADAPDVVINAAQFLKDGKVYGKCNLRITSKPGNLKLTPPPAISITSKTEVAADVPVKTGNSPVNSKPGNSKSVEPGNLNSKNLLADL